MKKCGYRNCKKDISNMRGNSKYCCRRHKEIEYVYRKRKIFIYTIWKQRYVQNAMRKRN